jgi:phage protein D
MSDQAYQIGFAGAAVDQDFYADVLSLRVEESVASGSSFQLQLATQVDDNGVWRYLDDDRFALFTKVSIKIGFTGGGGLAGALGALGSALGGGGGNDGLVPVFDGYVTDLRFDIASEPGDSSILVSGMDTSVLMSLEEKIVVWTNMSDSDVVKKIVGGYGTQVAADATTKVHQEEDAVLVQRASDVQFVRELAQRNGFEFYFETDQTSGSVTGYFRAPQLGGTPQPDLAIQFGDDSNLTRFSARLVGQRPLSIKLAQIDVATNNVNTVKVSDMQLAKLGDKDAGALVGGPLGSLVRPKDTEAQMLISAPATGDETELQTLAQALRDEAGWFITAEGEINGEAYQNVLRPRRLVLVKGAGKAYSGKYYVTRVAHEMSGDGTYTQKFEARRNARDVDGSEYFGAGGLGLSIPGI